MNEILKKFTKKDLELLLDAVDLKINKNKINVISNNEDLENLSKNIFSLLTVLRTIEESILKYEIKNLKKRVAVLEEQVQAQPKKTIEVIKKISNANPLISTRNAVKAIRDTFQLPEE